MSETVEIKKYDYEMLDFVEGKVFRAANDESSLESEKGEAVELVSDSQIAQENVEKEAAAEVAAAAVQEEIVEEVAAPEPIQTFTEEEMEAAKNLAKQEGLKEGMQKAQEQQDKVEEELQNKTNDLLARINAELPNISNSITVGLADIEKYSVNLAYGIAKKILGKKQAEVVEEEIQSSIKDALSQIGEKNDLRIAVHSSLQSGLEGKFENIVLENDDTILPTDFKIEWRNGFVEKKTDVILDEIAQIIETGKIAPKEIVEEAVQQEQEVAEEGPEAEKKEEVLTQQEQEAPEVEVKVNEKKTDENENLDKEKKDV